jgi:argininosuccinate synthase
MVEIARAESAGAIAHGATGKGNDQVRFELTAAALVPELRVIAPWRVQKFRQQFPGRAEMITFGNENKIPVEASVSKPYSMDRDLPHISYESEVLEDPWFDASSLQMRDMYKLSAAPEDAERSGTRRSCVRCRQLRRSERHGVIATRRDANAEYARRKHGIGRADIVENRFVGMKRRGVYETPGGVILHFTHRQMETLTMDREVMQLRDSLIPKYSTLVYNGFWFSPEREALQALVTETQRDVTGVVRLKLYKGNIIIAGRKSPKSLYDPQIATMEAVASTYDQGDATGFQRELLTVARSAG